MQNEVFITRVAKFLPNSPVSNSEMEDYLGLINDNPSKAKGLILRSNKIRTRYYSLDKNGKSTHTNAQMSMMAVKNLTDKSFTVNDIELLAIGTNTPDQLLPNHTTMVHGLLGSGPMEVASPAGSCCSGMQAFRLAYLALLSGDKNNAVCGGSEKYSALTKADNYFEESKKLKELANNDIIAFEKDFLRWMLSDGASVALFQNKKNDSGISLKINWVEMISFANELDTCMYLGAEKLDNGSLQGWLNYTQQEWLNKSLFSVKQDVKLLSSNIAQYGVDAICKILERRSSYRIEDLDYLLPHLSSEYFRDLIDKEMRKKGIGLPQSKWFTNLSRVGNVGSASPFLMLEELFNSGTLKKGQQILMVVPESARFSYAYAWLTVC